MCITRGCVCLGDGIYSVHGQCVVVLLLPLQGEHHLGQGVSDPPPLQDHTWQRVQRAELLQNILPTITIRFKQSGTLSRLIFTQQLQCNNLKVSPWWC